MRTDSRFEVVIRLDEENKAYPAVASEVGENGVRIESDIPLIENTQIQVIFPHSPDNARCFGLIRWCKPFGEKPGFESGVRINKWYGIMDGEKSFRRFRGSKKKKDRRDTKR